MLLRKINFSKYKNNIIVFLKNISIPPKKKGKEIKTLKKHEKIPNPKTNNYKNRINDIDKSVKNKKQNTIIYHSNSNIINLNIKKIEVKRKAILHFKKIIFNKMII